MQINLEWYFFTEWFQIQREFATPFEEMSPPELNKCLQKFYLSARKRDDSFYNKNHLPRSEPRWIVTCCFSPFRAGKYWNRCWNV